MHGRGAADGAAYKAAQLKSHGAYRRRLVGLAIQPRVIKPPVAVAILVQANGFVPDVVARNA